MRPEIPFFSRLYLLFLFFSFFNRVWHSVGSLEKKERKRKKKRGEKKETKNSYHKREHLPDESLSCYYSFRPSMVNRGIGRTLKINLSGIDSTIQRGFVRNLDSVERAELHLGFNRAWKWRFLISRNFLRMILSFFYYYYFLKINPPFDCRITICSNILLFLQDKSSKGKSFWVK